MDRTRFVFKVEWQILSLAKMPVLHEQNALISENPKRVSVLNGNVWVDEFFRCCLLLIGHGSFANKGYVRDEHCRLLDLAKDRFR